MLEEIYEWITGRCWHDYSYCILTGTYKCMKCEKVKWKG